MLFPFVVIDRMRLTLLSIFIGFCFILVCDLCLFAGQKGSVMFFVIAAFLDAMRPLTHKSRRPSLIKIEST